MSEDWTATLYRCQSLLTSEEHLLRMNSLNSPGLQLAGLFGLGVAGAVAYYWGRATASKNPKTKSKNIVLFFGENSSSCLMKDVLNEHSVDDCPLEQCPVKNMLIVKTVVRKATTCIDVCLYNLTLPAFEDLLISQIQKGITVRCVVGNRDCEEKESLKKLRNAGAFVTVKSHLPPKAYTYRVPQHLMHHKFVIVDKKILITGSMNWTKNSLACHWDHMIVSVDKYLVKQFVDEFEYLFHASSDDERSYNIRPKTEIPAQACFFRRANILCRTDANVKRPCEREDCVFTLYYNILHKIHSATVSIDICSQQLTLEDFARYMVAVKSSGSVKIRVLCDKHSVGTGSQIPLFVKEGIPVRMQTSASILHHKFIIVDGKTLLSGSLNWTMHSFYGNYENLLIITEASIVSKFQEEFERLWNEFTPVQN